MGQIAKASISLMSGLAALMALCVATAGQADEPPAPSKEEAAKKIEENAKRKDAALKSAESYLVLLDKGKYAESWNSMCGDVRRGLPQPKWVDALNQTRRPYGRLRSRKLNRIEMKATEDPKVLNQAWIYCDLMTMEGLYSNELAIVIFEDAKEWKVSGYYIGDPKGFPKPTVEDKDDESAEEKPEAKPAVKKVSKASKK